MDAKQLAEYIDHERWLLNSGLASHGAKNQLFMYGSIVHRDVKAVELEIDTPNRLVAYTIYMDGKLLKKHHKYMRLSTSNSIWGLWRFKRMLKKEGNLNFEHLLNQFVKEFCGPKWSVDLVLIDFDEYTDGFGDLDEGQREESKSANQQLDE